MDNKKVIKYIPIVLLCMILLASVGMNICQRLKLKNLSRIADSQPTVNIEPENSVPEEADKIQENFDINAPVAGRDKRTADEIDSLNAELSDIEQELDKANEKWAEMISKDQDIKENQQELVRKHRLTVVENQYTSLFEELDLSTEKLENLKDLLVERNLALYPERPMDESAKEDMTTVKERTDKVNEEYDAKLNEFLGYVDYEKYEEYIERSGSRANVTDFMRSLSTDEMLTKDQKKELIEIWYNEQEKASNEALSNPSVAPTTYLNDNMIAQGLNNLEKIHSKIIQAAQDTLSSSQLDKLQNYLKSQRAMLESSSK